jgi:hypothetical protein
VRAHRLHVGDQVHVHTKFSDSWVGGFEIADLLTAGYRVRRNSDGSLLPGPTSDDDLRAVPASRRDDG